MSYKEYVSTHVRLGPLHGRVEYSFPAPARGFGHVDPVSKDHAGPDATWIRQARRQRKRADKAVAKYPDTHAIHIAAVARMSRINNQLGG